MGEENSFKRITPIIPSRSNQKGKAPGGNYRHLHLRNGESTKGTRMRLHAAPETFGHPKFVSSLFKFLNESQAESMAPILWGPPPKWTQRHRPGPSPETSSALPASCDFRTPKCRTARVMTSFLSWLLSPPLLKVTNFQWFNEKIQVLTKS